MRYHTILFDADGTLLDFAAAQKSAFYESCAHFKIPADAALLQRYDSINHTLWKKLEKNEVTRAQVLVDRFRILFEETGYTNCGFAEFNTQYMQCLSAGCDLIEGALPLLTALQNTATLVIITNGFAATQKRRLANSGIARFFSQIVISEEIGFEKPHPEFFRQALSLAGTADLSSVLVVGDSLSADISGGSAYGLDTCWFNPDHLPLPQSPAPTYVIDRLDQLPKILALPISL